MKLVEEKKEQVREERRNRGKVEKRKNQKKMFLLPQEPRKLTQQIR